MFGLINDLLNYFGVAAVPSSFSDFIVWFVSVLIGMELVLYVLDMVFYTIRQLTKGVK